MSWKIVVHQNSLRTGQIKLPIIPNIVLLIFNHTNNHLQYMFQILTVIFKTMMTQGF